MLLLNLVLQVARTIAKITLFNCENNSIRRKRCMLFFTRATSTPPSAPCIISSPHTSSHQQNLEINPPPPHLSTTVLASAFYPLLSASFAEYEQCYHQIQVIDVAAVFRSQASSIILINKSSSACCTVRA